MGYEISPAAVIARLDAENQCLNQMIVNAYSLQEKIKEFIEEDLLTGKAYESSKNYYEAVHIPLIRGYILYAEEKIKENNKYRNQTTYCWNDAAYISEDRLCEQLENIRRLKRENPLTETITSFQSFYDNTEYIIKKQIDKIYEFVDETRYIYERGHSYTLLQQVKQGQRCISGVTYGENGNFFQLGPVNLEWATEIMKYDRVKYTQLAHEKYETYLIEHPKEIDKIIFILQYEDAHPDTTEKYSEFLSTVYQQDQIELKYITYRAEEPYRTILFGLAGTGCTIRIFEKNEEDQMRSTANASFLSDLECIQVKASALKGIRLDGYRTFFHEMGHGVEYYFAEEKVFDTRTPEIYQSLHDVVEKNITDMLLEVSGKTELTEQDQDILNYLLQGESNEYTLTEEEMDIILKLKKIRPDNILKGYGVSDVWSGITNNRLYGNYFHNVTDKISGEPTYYWFNNNNKPTYKQCSEFYATHFANKVIKDDNQCQYDELTFREVVKKMDELTEKIAEELMGNI